MIFYTYKANSNRLKELFGGCMIIVDGNQCFLLIFFLPILLFLGEESDENNCHFSIYIIFF